METQFVARGPRGRALAEHRDDVLRILHEADFADIRVFGSVARGEDDEHSDIDLLVTLPPDIGLFGIARAESQLSDLVGAEVELVNERALKPRMREPIGAEAVPL